MRDAPERRNLPARDDLELVRRILGGERTALAALAERLRCIPRALSLLDDRNGRLLRSDELADLVQDVLVRTWAKLREYEGLCALEGWVYGICELEYQNALRRGWKLRREARDVARHAGAPEGAARDPDPWAFEELHRSLERIGREEARVVRLKHFDGWTFEEIGLRLDLSPNTVKTRYYRGLVQLRELLEPNRARSGGPA